MAQRGRRGESPRRPSGSRTSLPHGSSASSPPISVVRFPLSSSSSARATRISSQAGARGQREHATQRKRDQTAPRPSTSPHRLCCSLRCSARFFPLPPFSLEGPSRSPLLQLAIPQSKHIPFSLTSPPFRVRARRRRRGHATGAAAAAAAGKTPRALGVLVDRESPPPVRRRAAAG